MRACLVLLLVLVFPTSGFAQADAVPAEKVPVGPEKLASVKKLAQILSTNVVGAVVKDGQNVPVKLMGPIYASADAEASGTLWLCPSSDGGPEAILAISSWRDRRFFELHSFSKHELKFQIAGQSWSPAPAHNPIKIPNAPKPEADADARLKQMQQLLTRFGCTQEFANKNPIELTILTKPIYRYPQATADQDGGVFVIARDKDPEALLLIETDGGEWSYLVGRMSANSMFLQFDETRTALEPRSRNGAYFLASRQADPNEESPAQEETPK